MMYHINYLKANIYSSGINVFAKSYAEAVERAAQMGIKEEDIVYVQKKEHPKTTSN